MIAETAKPEIEIRHQLSNGRCRFHHPGEAGKAAAHQQCGPDHLAADAGDGGASGAEPKTRSGTERIPPAQTTQQTESGPQSGFQHVHPVAREKHRQQGDIREHAGPRKAPAPGLRHGPEPDAPAAVQRHRPASKRPELSPERKCCTGGMAAQPIARPDAQQHHGAQSERVGAVKEETAGALPNSAWAMKLASAPMFQTPAQKPSESPMPIRIMAPP